MGARLDESLGYAFYDEALLRQALTHRSFLNECGDSDAEHNERLEFLGDAVLDLSVGQQLMERLPDAREGELSKLRAMLVSEASLARCAAELELGDHLMLGRGEEHSGGREKPSILSDALEALVGAVFLDGGYYEVDQVIRRVMAPLFDEALHGDLDRDHKTHLQELTQRRYQRMPTYRVVDEQGPDHAKTFVVVVSVGGRELARADGPSKKSAEQRAALCALERFDSG